MRKINLLYVITKLELGGAQKQLLSLISHLNRERFSPFLFTAKDGLLLPEALSINGLRIKRSRFLERPINPLKDLLALIEIYFFIKKNKIEIVHTHSSKAGILGRWAARLANVPVIVHTIHGWPFHQWQNPIIRQFYIFLEHLTAKVTHSLVAVCEHDIEKGIKFKISGRRKYTLIHYGIDKEKFTDYNNFLNKREELNINPNQAVVGMVACLKPQKSPQDYIKAVSLVIKLFPRTKFLLIGDGILRPKIERLIKRLKLNEYIMLTGWRKDIPQLLSTIDIFVLTSLWEGLSIAVLEALASKKPVVATSTGGIAEIIRERQNGFLIPPKNINLLADRLITLLRDDALRNKMAEEAKNSIGLEFSLGHMVNRTQGLYENLIEGRKTW